MADDLSDLDLLAFRFFKLFARYESRLKDQGFFTVGKKTREIAVNWDRFANERVGADYLKELGTARGAADYILGMPPKRQASDDEVHIYWAEVAPDDKSVQALFSHLRRMRNNLFHGAKFSDDWIDPDRSAALLSNGLQILEVFKGRLGM